MMVIIIFYLIICLSWTYVRYTINKKINRSYIYLHLLLDSIFYPVSYVFYTYYDLIKILDTDGKKGEEKK